MFAEVPVLPVVLPLAGVVLALLTWHLHHRGLLTAPRAAVALAVCVYAAGVLANTVFPIFLDKPRGEARWSDFVVLTPRLDYEVVDALTNIAVFVPIGLLLPLLLPRTSWPRLLLVATGVSAAIEVTQYATAHLLGGGHIADVDDLICNVLGAAVGLLALALLTRVAAVDRLVDRFRWSEPLRASTAPRRGAGVP